MSPWIWNQIILLSFLIATCLIYRIEIESLPSFASSFKYLTGFADDLFPMCCFLLAIGLVIPMLFVLNAVIFSSKYALIDPKISRKLYFSVVLQHLEMLLSIVCFQVFSVLSVFCEHKSLYFILRLSILGHEHLVSHFLSSSLIFILIFHAFRTILKIGINIITAFRRKYGLNAFLPIIIYKNAHFLVPYISCLGLYIGVLMNTAPIFFRLEDNDAVWSRSMIIGLITMYLFQY